MPTLTDLPDELVERLAPSGLFLVSKRIHAIALPSYYNKVTLDSGNIAAFVNTIIAKPALGMLVRDATVLHYYEASSSVLFHVCQAQNDWVALRESSIYSLGSGDDITNDSRGKNLNLGTL